MTARRSTQSVKINVNTTPTAAVTTTSFNIDDENDDNDNDSLIERIMIVFNRSVCHLCYCQFWTCLGKMVILIHYAN